MIRFPYLQGRHLLPIWVCLMLSAAAASATTAFDRAFIRRAASLVLFVWLAVHLTGFLQNLRRYTVGRNGGWGSILDSEWHPPMMSLQVVFALLVICVGMAVAILRQLLVQLEAQEPPEPTVSTTGGVAASEVVAGARRRSLVSSIADGSSASP